LKLIGTRVDGGRVRVTFTRLPDHEWGHVLIERDDGVAYRMHAGPVTAAIPHDLVHFTVEDALEVCDGVWGAIAGGVVFRSMTHVTGRRPPHAAQRSATLLREHRDRIMRAELLGGFIEAAAQRPAADLPGLTARWFATNPLGAPDLDGARRAVAALHRAQARWRALAIGERLVLDWPTRRRVAAARPSRRFRERAAPRRRQPR
jgi:hypothetical protein